MRIKCVKFICTLTNDMYADCASVSGIFDRTGS